MLSMPCPDNNTIAELVCKQLGPRELVEVEAHVADCPTCRKVVGMLAATSLPRIAASAVGTEPAPRRPAALIRAGATVGRYQIRGLLGAGAMGVVYKAHDPELDRSVALKLLHPELASDDAVASAHLLAEAQALAKMRHPNVVTVYDAGTHGDLVFVAMELVDGHTLRQWLAARRSWREVARLFVAAGHGLAAAHALGIVHRDFKPENVLIGDAGEVCVSDFGLARPVGSGGEIAGTPKYMAPEQRAGGASDPGADQYSFCVAFEEALEGTRAPAWVRAIIKRGRSKDPAARFASIDALLAQLRKQSSRRRRGLVVLAVGGLLAGTVGISRWALDASPPSCRFERELDGVWDGGRRRAVESAFSRSDPILGTVAAEQAAHALDEYATAWTRMRTEACEAASARTQTDRLVDLRMSCLDRRRTELGALVRVFEAADRDVVRKAVTAARTLEPLAECANTRALLARHPMSPEARARMTEWSQQLATSRSDAAVGRYRPARELAARVAADARALGAREIEAEAMLLDGTCSDKLAEPERAGAAYRDAALAAESTGNDDLAARARVLRVKPAADLRKFEDGHEHVRAARAAIERAGGSPPLAELLATHEAILLAAEDKPEDARARFQTALEIALRHYGANDPMTARAHNNLGGSQMALGKYADAQASYERALEIRRRVLGDQHPDVGTSHQSLGQVLSFQGKTEPALAQFRLALAINEASFGVDHPSASRALHGIAGELVNLGRYDEALAMQRRLLGVLAPVPNAQRQVALVHNSIADVLELLGRRDEALAEYQIAIAMREKLLGRDHVELSQSLTNMAIALTALGRHDDALAALERSLQIKAGKLPPDHVNLVPALIGIGRVEIAAGRPARAIAHLERAEAILVANAADPVDLATCRYALAQALWETNRSRARALALARTAREVFAGAGAARAEDLQAVDDWLATKAAPDAR
jgi:tetratricopeptide (TPR) repeat protein